MTENITNKTVIITGGAKRIGANIVEFLHSKGMNVLIHFRSSELAANELKDKLNNIRKGSAEIFQADINDPDSCKNLIEKTLSCFNRIDALINNASTYFKTPLNEINIADWDNLMGSNLKGPLFLSKFACDHLRQSHGSIINIADAHINSPKEDYIVYSIAKAGLITLTKSLAKDLGPEVRVNAIAPGPIVWPENEEAFSRDYQQKVVSETILKKTGAPENISEAIYFLLENAPFTTGHILNVDGGRSFS